jgi:hypothetical protein
MGHEVLWFFTETAAISDSGGPPTFFYAFFAFLGVLVTAIFGYLGTRNKGERHGYLDQDEEIDKLQRNYAKTVESLREHRELLIENGITPPAYPQLEL